MSEMPVLALREKREETDFTRFMLEVSNYDKFPNELFSPAPDLPPCGANHNASRTWVDIYNGTNNQRIYGFCALSCAKDLTGIWFAIQKGQPIPGIVYIKMTDRRTGTIYQSNNLYITGEMPVLVLREKREETDFTRFMLEVSNYDKFPNELFSPAPDLPPCDANHNASRTWVDIYNGTNNQRIHGFCALSCAKDLTGIWFAIQKGQSIPGIVYIKMTDRRTGTIYQSNNLVLNKSASSLTDLQKIKLKTDQPKSFRNII